MLGGPWNGAKGAHVEVLELLAEDYLRHYEMLVGAKAKSFSRSLDPAIALQE